jgi:hypothetical protein
METGTPTRNKNQAITLELVKKTEDMKKNQACQG